MHQVKKSLAVALLLCGMTAGVATAQTAPAPAFPVAFNVGVWSQYIFRGLSQTDFKPAIQGGADYAHDSGLYVGVWGSNIQWLRDFGISSGRVELDIYGGYKKSFTDDIALDVGFLRYQYLGSVKDGFVNPNTMRWIKQIDPNWPVGWGAGFTDPDSAYAVVLIEDSADFVLPFPDDCNDKLILNVDHNFVIDTSYIRFKVFPIDHPEDSLWLNFCVIIHAPDLSITNLNNEPQEHVGVLNQTPYLDTQIQHAEVNIYDPGGKVVFSSSDFSDNQVDISGLNTGLYFIRFESDHTAFTRKFFWY